MNARILLLPAAAAALLTLCVGCGSSSDGAAPTSSSPLTLALTDAPSDALERFVVDVDDVTLTRPGGGTVDVLTTPVRVDLAELDGLAEVVASTTLAPGSITSIALTLDFTAASVVLVDGSAANVVDRDGNALSGPVAVTIGLAASARPEILTGRRHLLELDFDLDQALVVDMTTREVRFDPVVTATLDPLEPTPLAAAGELVGVNSTTGVVTIARKAADGIATAADLTVATDASTVFQIDGITTVGATGLGDLAAVVAANLAIRADGAFDPASGQLLATSVTAGIGTRGNGQDWVRGHVVARDTGFGFDATLTVVGTSFDDSSGNYRFDTTFSIPVAIGVTDVLRRGDAVLGSTNDLNVGTRVLAFGTLSGRTLDATSAMTGVVRVLDTEVFGTAVAAPAGTSLTLDLARIGPLPVTDFDFDVFGLIEADPAMFVVDATGFEVSGIESGDRLAVRGVLNQVGIGGDPNFVARELSDRSRSGGTRLLTTTWNPAVATTTVLPTIADDRLALDIAMADSATVDDGVGGAFAILAAPMPTLVPADTSGGDYRIVDGSTIEVHHDFAAFATALDRVAATTSVDRVAATGVFNESTQQLRADAVTVVLR